jgi:hypothetical protein
MTTWSKKPLTRGLHRRRYDSMMQGYKNVCTATTSNPTVVETTIMSKRSLRYVHQIAV